MVVYNVETGIGLAGGSKRKGIFNMKKLIIKLKKININSHEFQ